MEKRVEFILNHITSSIIKHGGGNNLMVWGCIGGNSVGMLIEVEENMDADQYCQILSDRMVKIS